MQLASIPQAHAAVASRAIPRKAFLAPFGFDMSRKGYGPIDFNTDIGIRKIMSGNELKSGDFMEADEPFSLFGTWFEEARSAEVNDPNALSLATVDADGMPNVRMVLLKDFDRDGFVFFTNLESQKGTELLGQKKAAMVFHWKSLRRQVRIRGSIELVADAEADAYFDSRPRGSRIGAWASKQSRQLESRFALEKAVAEYTVKFGIGAIPRPPHWSGFRLRPISIEFWHDRPFRLHDRVEFRRDGEAWEKVRMYP